MVGSVAGDAGSQTRRPIGLRAARPITRSPAPPRCRPSGCCCCSIWKRPAASCPIWSASASAAPPAARHDQDVPGKYGVEVIHAWGMTEMSPLGTTGSLKPEYAGLQGERSLGHQAKAGPHAVRRRDEDHRRCRAGPCRGTARPSAASRCAASPWPRPITNSKTRSSTPTAFSIPATSAPWTATAICRSPTAPRT